MTNNTNTAITITNSGKITAVISGNVYTIDVTHPNYANILQSVKDADYDKFLDLVDLTRKVRDYVHSVDIQVKDGTIIYKGEIIHNALTKKIISFMEKDLPVKPLFNFLQNLMQNPSKRSVDELCNFLDVGNLPYTEDGHFLAFKNVKSDYYDIHSGKFRNQIGDKPEMPRNQVDDDKDRTCSTGLHFCSIAYLPHFSDASGGHTMIVKINPADVVSIPADYNNTKGRTCKYEVVDEYTDNWRERLGRGENGFDHDLYSSDGGDYDDSDYCDGCGDELTTSNYDGNGDDLCETCYDDVYSGCTGGGCAGKTTLTNEDEYPKTSRNYDPVKNPEIEEEMQKFVRNLEDEVGNEGRDGCCGGSCHCEESEAEPAPAPEETASQKYHNLRDALGRFIKAIKESDNLG